MSIYDKAYLSLDTYAPLPSDMTRQQKCVSCGAMYRECENIGRHLCRIHPGLKLVDSRTSRVFYSCCNYEPHTYGFDANLLAHGCLQMDHISGRLVSEDMTHRAQQLRTFGLLVMPKVLTRFLTTRIIASNILFDSECVLPGSGDGVFRHSFDVLEHVVASYREKRLAATAYNSSSDAMSIVDTSELSVTWPIQSILCDLTSKSRASPLLSRLMPELSYQTRSISRDCDAIWRGGLQRPSTPLNDESCAASIPFVIIARINTSLDGCLK